MNKFFNSTKVQLLILRLNFNDVTGFCSKTWNSFTLQLQGFNISTSSKIWAYVLFLMRGQDGL